MSTTHSSDLCDYEAGERITEILKRKFPQFLLESCEEGEEEAKDDFIEAASIRMVFTIQKEQMVWRSKFSISDKTLENLFSQNWLEKLQLVLEMRRH